MTVRADTLERRRKLAITFIRNAGGWVTAKDVCEFLGLNVEQVTRALTPAIESGVLDRQHVQGGTGGSKLAWRIAEAKPASPSFSIDWPPGFVPQLATTRAPTWGDRS